MGDAGAAYSDQIAGLLQDSTILRRPNRRLTGKTPQARVQFVEVEASPATAPRTATPIVELTPMASIAQDFQVQIWLYKLRLHSSFLWAS